MKEINDEGTLNTKNVRSSTPDFGLGSDTLDKLNAKLGQVLADEYVLYTKLRKFHWQVKGMQFAPLHQLFEEQYQTVIGFADEIAELIQIYGGNTPGTLEEFSDQTTLRERPGVTAKATEMLHILTEDHEKIVKTMRDFIDMMGNEFYDPIVEDRLIDYITSHQQMAWMLRAHIEY